MEQNQIGINTIISPGEILDKLSILEIKLERITDNIKHKNIQIEYDLLQDIIKENLPKSTALNDLYSQLKSINESLWDIEDDIRDCERQKDFSQTFIDLARAVYITNDQRADIKKQINQLLGSKLVEEKSYQPY